MIEAALTSETSVDNYFTRQYIPEDDSEFHTRRRENLKSHTVLTIVQPAEKRSTLVDQGGSLSLSQKAVIGPYSESYTEYSWSW
jgi:hypothetical protein